MQSGVIISFLNGFVFTLLLALTPVLHGQVPVIGQPPYQSVVNDSLLTTNPEKAARLYAEAYQKLPAETPPGKRASLLNLLGQAKYLLGAYSEALTYLKQALDLYESISNDTLVARQLSEIGSAYYFSNFQKTDKTLEYFIRARDLYQSLGVISEAQFNENYTGYIYWAEGEGEKALAIHQKSFAVFDSLNNLRGKAISSSDVGFTLNSLGRFEEALKYNLRALKLARQLHDSIIVVPILNNIAISYQNLGKLNESIRYSQQSLALAVDRKLNLRSREALFTLQNTYSLGGEYQKAYKALLRYQEIDDSIQSSKQIQHLVGLESARAVASRESELRLEQERKDAAANAKLEREVQRRNGLIIIAILLSILAVSLFFNYRLRVRSNKRLRATNRELKLSKNKIEEQNEALEKSRQTLEKANTELTRLLRELQEAQAKLVQYEKLASLGVLVSGVAHEINNPLNYIQGGIYGLEDLTDNIDQEEKRQEAKTLLSYMAIGVGRASEIVSELNDFSKNSVRKEHVPCNVHQVLENCLVVLRPRITECQCHVRTDFAPEEIIIRAHEGSLHQIFSNLIYNSILAVDEGGLITIKTIQSEDGGVVITVEDNGSGMTPEVMDKIFDPFFTTREADKGTGLGLYITYKLVHSHHGNIKFKSNPGSGTKAMVHLPKEAEK